MIGDEAFPRGAAVRVAGGYGYVWPYAYRGIVGRVIGTESTTGRIQVRFPRGMVNVDGEFAHVVSVGHDGTDGTFHADWLHRVAYVSARFHGPALGKDGRSIGSRYVVTGRRGDRYRLTWRADHSLTPEDNYTAAVMAYARRRLEMCDPHIESWQDRRNGGRVYAITEHGTCDCSEEYGPCEWHGENVITREGASLRSGDELGHLFLSDVASACQAWPSEEFRSEEIRLGNALADSGGTWFDDPDDGDALQDMIRTAESFLSDHGLSVWWQDGYRIARITGGPYAR